MKRKDAALISLPALFLLAALFLIPLGATLSRALAPGILLYTLKDPTLLHVLGFTLFQATLSTLCSLAAGLPLAFLMADYSFRGKKLIKAICTVPFVLPSILVVLGFVIFWGNNGILNRIAMRITGSSEPPFRVLYSLKAIIMAHTFYNFPVASQLISTFKANLDDSPERAARTLGASPLTVFRTITLPRLMPVILSSAVLIFLYCYNSFAIIMVLGGGPKYTTMETRIYRWAKISMKSDYAAAIALISITVTLLLLLLYFRLQKKGKSELTFKKQKPPARPLSAPLKALIVLYTIAAAIFILGPIGSVIVRSFTASDGGFSLDAYRTLFQGTGGLRHAKEAIQNSVVIASITAVVTIAVSLSLTPLMEKREKGFPLLEILQMLPVAVSSVIIGLGYLFIASRLRSGGYALVICAHMIVVIPFSLRALTPVYRMIPPNYRQAARTLGADRTTSFRTILLPLLRPALLTGALFCFALSLGELNATLTLSGGKIKTIPLILYQLIGSYNFRGACALGTLLILISLLAFLLDEKLKGDTL